MALRNHIPSASVLLAFEAAARLCNFSRAAAELNVTQPAISHAVSSLERYLDQKLFVRAGPVLTLTESGERLSRVTSRSFAQIEAVLQELQARSRDREVVMMSLSSGLVAHWLMPRYDAFRQAFPDIDLQFQLLPGSVGGSLGNCDLGLRSAVGMESQRLGGWFAPERVVALGTPTYLRERGTLEQPLGRHTLINLPKHTYGWPEFLSQTGLAARGPYEMLSFPDYAVVLQSTIGGQGLGLGWTSVVSKLIIDGVLAPAADAVVHTDRSYHLILSSQRAARPCVIAVRDWLIAQMESEERQIQDLFRGATHIPTSYS